MRVNVYDHEMPQEVAITNETANGVLFKGIRFFSGKRFEHTPGDDDSSALTFWFTADEPYKRNRLRLVLQQAIELLDQDEKSG